MAHGLKVQTHQQLDFLFWENTWNYGIRFLLSWCGLSLVQFLGLSGGKSWCTKWCHRLRWPKRRLSAFATANWGAWPAKPFFEVTQGALWRNDWGRNKCIWRLSLQLKICHSVILPGDILVLMIFIFIFATAKLGHLSMAFPQFPLFFPETLRPSYIMLFTATASIPSAPTSSWQFLSLWVATHPPLPAKSNPPIWGNHGCFGLVPTKPKVGREKQTLTTWSSMNEALPIPVFSCNWSPKPQNQTLPLIFGVSSRHPVTAYLSASFGWLPATFIDSRIVTQHQET